MKNLFQSRKLKLISATSVAIFSLAAVFLGTYAWFVTANQIPTTGPSVQLVSHHGKLKKITFHKMTSKTYVPNSETVEQFHFDKTPSGVYSYDWLTKTGEYTGDTSITLDEYNPLNQNHPIMLLFEFMDEYDCGVDPVHIEASAQATDYLGQRDETTKLPTHPLTDTYDTLIIGGEEVDFYAMSSVAAFSKKIFSSSSFTTFNNLGSTYDFYLSGQDSDARFVLEQTNSFTVVDNEAEVSSFNQHIQLVNATSGRAKYAAIVIDYYVDAVEYIYSTFLGDETLEVSYDYLLNYICDWSMEVY